MSKISISDPVELEFQREHEGHIWIDCDCMSHALRVESFVDLKGGGRFYQDFHFAIWDQAIRLGLWQRIKVAFRVLRTGKMDTDHIMIGSDKMIALRDFLNKKVIETEN